MKKITIILAIIMFLIMNNQKKQMVIIPNEAIRVRIIANSEKTKDIKIKETLKNDIKPMIYNLLKDVEDVETARLVLKQNIPGIKVEIEKSLKTQNINTTYDVNYGFNYFPEKEYKGIKYSKGNYESLVITIGDGEGENWWCILFPPLCMIDEQITDIEYASIIKELINKYNV